MWKKEPPKKSGYYWVKQQGALSDKIFVHPVHIYNMKNEDIHKPSTTVFSDGENFSIKNERFLEWWNEEIPMPAIPRPDLPVFKLKTKLY